MKVLNLTQHVATQDQMNEGVFEPKNKEMVQSQLTFDTLESTSDMKQRAVSLAEMAILEGAEGAMVGGAPYFMPVLVEQLKRVGVKPLFAFSTRESVDVMKEDGSVVKSMVFKHKGFVKA